MKNFIKAKLLMLMMTLLVACFAVNTVVYAYSNAIEIHDSIIDIPMERLQSLGNGDSVLVGSVSAPIGSNLFSDIYKSEESYSSQAITYDICRFAIWVSRDAQYGNIYELDYRVYTTGSLTVNCVQASNVTVKDTSILFPKTYYSKSLYQNFNGTTSYYGNVGAFIVDDPDVDKVRVEVDDLKVYVPHVSAWQSLFQFAETVPLP